MNTPLTDVGALCATLFLLSVALLDAVTGEQTMLAQRMVRDEEGRLVDLAFITHDGVVLDTPITAHSSLPPHQALRDLAATVRATSADAAAVAAEGGGGVV